MADTINLRQRFRIGGDDALAPLIAVAKAQAERLPGLALEQIDGLVRASAESAKIEAERLKKRYGDADPRWRARAQQGEGAEALLDLIGKARKAADIGETLKPMTIVGRTARADGKASSTVEVVEDTEAGWIVVRGLSDLEGRFEVAMDAPAAAYGAGEDLKYLVVIRDATGREVGRSRSFAFTSGKTVTAEFGGVKTHKR